MKERPVSARIAIGSALTVCMLLCVMCRGPQTRIEGLEAEHLVCPLGIDNPSPRLSWRMADSREGACQTSYRIIVGTDRKAVESGKGEVWDSGTVTSNRSMVTYAGGPLEPFTRYWWKVIAGDMDGKTVSSDAEWFETGVMGQWSEAGQWIDDGKDTDWGPAPYFRKGFSVGKKVKSARAYIASAGVNILYVNGKKIGDRILDPAFTRFDERILYTTWDITSSIREGENAVGVILGNTWYNHQPKAAWDYHEAYWRARPTFRMDIRITYEDGETVTIPTDTSWKSFSDGPIIYNNIYTGERYDARREINGWNDSGFDDSLWHQAMRRESPTRRLEAQAMHPLRPCREYRTATLNKINDTSWVYDFGQNMSGTVAISIKGKEGTGVALRYGERIFGDGHVDQTNIDYHYRGDKRTEPFQTDSLFLSKNGVEFTPQLSYKGFRYIQVNSTAPLSLDKNSLTAYFVHTDVPEAGNLEASSDMLEKIGQAARMAYLSNLVGYPTDCPQREKNGWTGDAHIAVETGLYNFDGFTLYEKWMSDHRDAQLPNGVLPDIIPTDGWGLNGGEDKGDNGLDWTSTIAIIPWELYLFYGDDKPLRDCYENIKRYVDFATAHTDGLLSHWGRGDWVPVTQKSDPTLIFSIFHFNDCKILSRAAELCGKTEDAEYYAELAERIRKAINDEFLDPETGIYADGMQTSLSMPLCFGVVPDEARAKVAARLAEMVRANGYHIDAGVHGAKYVPNALAMNGYIDEAYRMAVQDTYPSWGWWIVNGKTTFTENWDVEACRDMSDNHIMYGDIAAWFYRWIGGILPDPEMPGFKRVVIKPGFPDGLDSFSCHHDSPYGRIISGWTRSGGEITYKVTIPANSTGLLWLPGCEGPIEISSGNHRFSFKQ